MQQSKLDNYASPRGAVAGRLTSMVGSLLFWMGVGLFYRLDPRLPVVAPRVSVGIGGTGLLLVLICVGRYGLGMWPALFVSLALVSGMATLYWRRTLTPSAAPSS